MGSIRTILAIAVIFSHTYGFMFVGGRVAVQMFYMISGFLMSYILVEAKTYKTPLSFYLNRFLRIFPTYWFVALLTLGTIFFTRYFLNQTHPIISTFDSLHFTARLSLILSNFFIYGQDWIMFTGVRDGIFQFVSNYRISDVQVWKGLLVPQAWTLGVELTFYLIAPYILKKKRLMISLLACSIMLRAYIIYIGLGTKDPWTYRFFPTELAFFLLGAFSHQFLKPFYAKKNLFNKKISSTFTLVVFAYICVYFLLPHRAINNIIIVALFVFSMPHIFKFQSENKWDRMVGELSYPMYISHMLVIWTVGYYMNSLGMNDKSMLRTFTIIIVTVILSLLINVTLIKYIEKYRRKVKSKQVRILNG